MARSGSRGGCYRGKAAASHLDLTAILRPQPGDPWRHPTTSLTVPPLFLRAPFPTFLGCEFHIYPSHSVANRVILVFVLVDSAAVEAVQVTRRLV